MNKYVSGILMDHKELTQSVMLDNDIKAYFTPGHEMADFWPTTIEWRMKNVPYTVSWAHLPATGEKAAIIVIANSMIGKQ